MNELIYVEIKQQRRQNRSLGDPDVSLELDITAVHLYLCIREQVRHRVHEERREVPTG